MRIFSYRNKRLLKRTLLIALAVLLGILALIVCRFIYLGRFVTYDNAGAHLDYEQHLTATRTPEPAVSDEDFSFDTVLDAASEEDGDTAQTAKLTGYYITTTMLASGVDQVRAALSQADDYNAVMVDVKSIFGSFYYSTAISGAAKATVLDIKQVDQLIAELAQQKGVTLIARVPAFSDPEYSLKHQSQALPLYNGALWTDENNCYWMNPYSNDVQGYLTSIALELANLGFDEVLFDDFYFPDSDRISWTGSVTKQEAVLDAADNLSANLLNQSIRLDLGTSDPEVAAYASRVFIATNNASQIDSDKETLADHLFRHKKRLDIAGDGVVFLRNFADFHRLIAVPRILNVGVLRRAVALHLDVRRDVDIRPAAAVKIRRFKAGNHLTCVQRVMEFPKSIERIAQAGFTTGKLLHVGVSHMIGMCRNPVLFKEHGILEFAHVKVHMLFSFRFKKRG